MVPFLPLLLCSSYRSGSKASTLGLLCPPSITEVLEVGRMSVGTGEVYAGNRFCARASALLLLTVGVCRQQRRIDGQSACPRFVWRSRGTVTGKR